MPTKLSSSVALLPGVRLCFFAFFACSGSSFYYDASYTPPMPYVAGLCVVATFIAYILRRANSVPPVYALFLCITWCAAGWLSAYTELRLTERAALSYEIRAKDIEATLYAVERDGKKVKLYLKDMRYDDGFEMIRPSWHARLSAFASMLPEGGVKTGSAIRIPRATLTPLPLPMTPGGYDFAFFMYFKNIGAIGFLTSRVKVISRGDDQPLNRIREAVFNNIVGKHPSPETAVAAALFTGERGMIADDVLTFVRRAGLAHLLAISGMHVGIVTGLCFFVFRRGLACIPALANRYDIRRPAAFLALCGAGFYVLLTGAPVSAQRAFFMAGLFLIGLVCYRRSSALQSAGLAALVLCAVMPHITMHPGFRMSFCAVIAIIAMFSHIERRKRMTKIPTRHKHDGNVFARIYAGGRKAALYIGGAGLSSLAATIATTPFAVYHFHQFTLQGVWTNLIAIPLTAMWIMPAGTLGILLMPLKWHTLPLDVSAAGISQLLHLAETAASTDTGIYTPTAPSGAALFLWVSAVMSGFLLHGVARLIALPCAAAALLLYMLTPVPDVFISEDAKLFAAVSGDTLSVNTRRSGRYARSRWQETAGLARTASIMQTQEHAGFSCVTSLRCVYRHRYGTVLFSDEQSYVNTHQTQADIAVLLKDGLHAATPIVIDRRALHRGGTHTILFSEERPPVVKAVTRTCPAGCPWRKRAHNRIYIRK